MHNLRLECFVMASDRDSFALGDFNHAMNVELYCCVIVAAYLAFLDHRKLQFRWIISG